MAKVKTTKPWEYNSARTTGFGQIKFDENGISEELKDEVAIALVKASPSLVFEGEEPKGAVAETVETTEEDEVLSAQLNQDVEEEEEQEESEEEESEEEEETENQQEPQNQEEQDDVPILTKEDLSGLKISELREMLVQAEVPEEEYSQFKGKEHKDALIDFVLSKI